MNLRELIVKISTGLLMVSSQGHDKSDAELEELLERIKFLWLAERPLKLQNQN